MSSASPSDFRRGVVEVARRREAPLSQIPQDFGISDVTLHNCLTCAPETVVRFMGSGQVVVLDSAKHLDRRINLSRYGTKTAFGIMVTLVGTFTRKSR